MTGFLTPHWEHPATTWCVYCGQQISLTWSSSAIGHNLYHAQCWTKWKQNQDKETK